MKSEKLRSIKPHHAGCLCCPGAEKVLSMETVLSNGFGGWHIERNGELFFMDDHNKEWRQFKKMQYIENKAKKDTKADWKAINYTPLHGETYQRQRGKWVLVEQNMGFA
jgi:hypothetical protein